MLPVEPHVHIWQVSLQQGCSNTCQIWTWYNKCNFKFWNQNCTNEKHIWGSLKALMLVLKINDRAFSNPNPRPNEQDDSLPQLSIMYTFSFRTHPITLAGKPRHTIQLTFPALVMNYQSCTRRKSHPIWAWMKNSVGLLWISGYFLLKIRGSRLR